MVTIFLARFIDHEETEMYEYIWKWMLLGALGRTNNADFEEKRVNDNIMWDCALNKLLSSNKNLLLLLFLLLNYYFLLLYNSCYFSFFSKFINTSHVHSGRRLTYN